jgi:hypothetical protein
MPAPRRPAGHARRLARGGRCARYAVVWIGAMCPIPVAGTRRCHLAGIVIGGLGKITRRWSRNDPCGSCGGAGPRRSLGCQEVPRIRSATEVGAVGDRLDLRVHDIVALDEIELYAEVLSAVAASDHVLTPEELDEVLGVRSVA